MSILKEYHDAFEQCNKVLEYDPNNSSAHYNLGIAYISLNDKVSALEQYKILKSLDPEKANELFNFIYE